MINSNLIQVIYILSLSQDELSKYINSINLNGGYIISKSNNERIDSEYLALVNLFIEIYGQEFYDYEIDNYVEQLLSELIYYSETSCKYDLMFLPNIYREITKKIIDLLNIDILNSMTDFEDLLHQYGFEIHRPTYTDLLIQCRNYYPFKILNENYEIGKNLLITDEEKKIYGGFSEAISVELEGMFDNFINSLISEENTSYKKTLECFKDFKKQLDKFNQEFINKNGYNLIDYRGKVEINNLILLIANTAQIQEGDFWQILFN